MHKLQLFSVISFMIVSTTSNINYVFEPIYRFFSPAISVVAQSYKVDVETLAASRGCTAILRCVVPSFVKELVRVVSWVQEPAFFIYPSLQGGECLHILVTSHRNILRHATKKKLISDGKYHLLPSGELLIHNLEYNDRYASYRCRTMHKLTRQVVISNSAKIRMNGQWCDK